MSEQKTIRDVLRDIHSQMREQQMDTEVYGLLHNLHSILDKAGVLDEQIIPLTRWERFIKKLRNAVGV